MIPRWSGGVPPTEVYGVIALFYNKLQQDGEGAQHPCMRVQSK